MENYGNNIREILRPSGEPYMWVEVVEDRIQLKFANIPKYIISFAVETTPQLMEALDEGYNRWFSGNHRI